MKPLQPFLWISTLSVALAVTTRGADQPVDFAKDIQPILLKTCVECHGPEKQKGKLRLDTKADAFKSDEVIVAGKADESEFYKRITLPAGHDDIMPNKGEPLTKAQTDLIRDWINQGAAWPDGLVIKVAEDKTVEKDPREPVKPSPAEEKAIAQLGELGVHVRPVAMNVTWTMANFRGIDSNQVDNALALLANVKTLEDLNLAGQALKEDSLKNISGLVNLTRLHLEKTSVTDAALAHLKGLENLQYLNLYDTQISDAGLAHLKGLQRLKNLYLWQTKVTDDGAKELQAALPKVDINRGWELIAQALKAEEEKKKEEAKKEEAKKEEEAKKTEAKPEENKEEKKDEPKKEEAKKDDQPKEEKKEEKKDQ